MAGNSQEAVHLARTVLVFFLLTFMLARIIVFLIMTRRIPNLFLHIKGAHVHHLNYGIFLLSAVGAYLLFGQPSGMRLWIAAAVYGVGMGLTFDEFGMWVHLGGSYWQRASWDAVVVLGACFGLIAFAPSLERFRPVHWVTTILLILVAAVFLWLFRKSFNYAGRALGPKFHEIETTSPR